MSTLAQKVSTKRRVRLTANELSAKINQLEVILSKDEEDEVVFIKQPGLRRPKQNICCEGHLKLWST